jgi:hypothetical protein
LEKVGKKRLTNISMRRLFHSFFNDMDIFAVYFGLHVKCIFSADPLKLEAETGILSDC